MKVFFGIFFFLITLPVYADIVTEPSPEIIKLCVDAFGGSNFLVLNLFFILSLLILSVSLLRWIIKKRLEKINIVLFICALVFCIVSFVFAEKIKPSACLGNKSCEMAFHINSWRTHDWCSNLAYKYINRCREFYSGDPFCLKEDYDCISYIEEADKKCDAKTEQHWQYRIFKNFYK